jgi:predicted Rossmann fold flavoprotein
MKKIVIVGAGASGLMASIYLKEQANKQKIDLDIILVEKNERVGKKILSTGNGKCNFTNMFMEPIYYNNPEFVKPILDSFTCEDLQSWFLSKGLYSKADKEGRIYPITESANSVLDIFRIELEKNNIRVITSFTMNSIKQKGNGYIISDGTNNIYADSVIISTGGLSAPALGTNGDGHRALKNHNISLTKMQPGLVGVKTNKESIKTLSGLRAKALVTLYENNQIVKKEFGEIQFKDDGISGIVVMNLASNIKSIENAYFEADLLSSLSEDDIVKYLLHKQNEYGNLFVTQMFVGILPNILSLKIIKDLGYKENTKIKHLPKTEFSKIACAIKKYPFKLLSFYGYDRSQVTVGGVDVNEVNDNLELHKLPNVYLCGEILDVDGMCGGYNLHFAFASAVYVSNAIINK